MDAKQREEGRRAARQMARTVENEAIVFLNDLGIEDVEDFIDNPIPRLSDLDDWVEEHEDEIEARKEEFLKGMGFICALVYQQAVLPFGLGWIFCEQYDPPEIVLGPGISQGKDGLVVTYENPFEIASRSWDYITMRRISIFFGHQVPGGLADMQNRVAVSIAQQNNQWVPPMFYINGATYDDEE